jgi:nucleoside-diphosphate-sugar epimerase
MPDPPVPPGHRRALVTGAAGFVGSHLVPALLDDGWEVHVVLRPSSDRTPLHDVLDRVVCHAHDGGTPGLAALVRAARPGTVFHLASLFVAEHREEDIEPLVRSNLLFATQLLEAMAACGVPCLVNTGSAWQHHENRPYGPVCLYAATKQAFEAIVQFYAEARDLRAVTLQLSDTYGPGDRRPKLFNLLRSAARSGAPLEMSAGEQRLDLVHVDDVVAAYLLAARRARALAEGGHEIYSVHGGEPIRLKDLVELYARLARRPVTVSWGAKPYRAREMMAPWSGGAWLPGWRPRISLREGIRTLIESEGRG